MFWCLSGTGTTTGFSRLCTLRNLDRLTRSVSTLPPGHLVRLPSTVQVSDLLQPCQAQRRAAPLQAQPYTCRAAADAGGTKSSSYFSEHGMLSSKREPPMSGPAPGTTQGRYSHYTFANGCGMRRCMMLPASTASWARVGHLCQYLFSSWMVRSHSGNLNQKAFTLGYIKPFICLLNVKIAKRKAMHTMTSIWSRDLRPRSASLAKLGCWHLSR